MRDLLDLYEDPPAKFRVWYHSVEHLKHDVRALCLAPIAKQLTPAPLTQRVPRCRDCWLCSELDSVIGHQWVCGCPDGPTQMKNLDVVHPDCPVVTAGGVLLIEVRRG